MSKILSKILRNAIAGNKCILGSREVLKYIDRARLVICSNTLDEDLKRRVREVCDEKGIVLYDVNSTSRELGRLCNKPFRISILSITDIDESDLSTLRDNR